MKRSADLPAVDHRADRNKWADLVGLSHAAAASDAAAALKALSDRALAAETCWTMLAPFPRGLVCRVLSRLAWAYGRQADAALRGQMKPLLIASAGMVDELFQQTAAQPSEPPSSLADTQAPALRLPYADA